jgi:hypothetical protein
MPTVIENIQGSAQIRAAFQPKSINTEERTVDVIFATENEVLMYDWSIGRFKEILVCEDGAGDLSRLNNGAPLCDTHLTYSVRTVLGVVVVGSARFEKGQGIATIRFSKRDDVTGVWNDVVDGILTGISVSYIPIQYEEINNVENTIPTLRATKWEATEISLAPVQADKGCLVRSSSPKEGQQERQVKLIRNSNNNIMSKPITGTETSAESRAAAPVVPPVVAQTETPATEIPSVQLTEAESRAAQKGAAEERVRASEITKATRAAKLDVAFGQKLIDDGTSLEAARKLIIDKMAENETAAPALQSGARVGKDTEDKRRESLTAALSLRSGTVQEKDLKAEVVAGARQYRSLSLLEIAKDCLTRAGIDFSLMDKMEMAQRAFTSSTSDFPVLLGGVIHQTLLSNYQAVADTWRNFCSIGSVSDFRPYKRLRMGSFSRLDKVKENGEFKNKKIPDAEFESIQAETYGNIINVSRQMIVNDDLAAFSKLATMLGRAAARSIEIDVYALLASNPTLEDGVTLFHADHGNLVTGAAMTAIVFDSMRQKMARQMDPSGNDFLDLRPSILLTGITQGSTARVINDSLYDPDAANKLQRPNLAKGIFSNIIDTARIAGNEYYAFAAPAEEPVIEVSFLDGNQTPFLETQMGFEVDGMSWKVRHDYAVGAVGFRGVVKNPGA